MPAIRYAERDNHLVDVRDSKIYGLSLYAKAPLPARTIIADWTGGTTYRAEKASLLPNGPPLFIQDHAIQIGADTYIDTPGIGRYFAHSCEPNCGYDGDRTLVTMRAVERDEELTFDWAMSEDSDWIMDCLCGKDACRGVFGSAQLVDRTVLEAYGPFVSSWLREKYRL